MPEMAGLLLIDNFRVGNGCLTFRTPVDNPVIFVNISFFIELYENFLNCLVAAFVHSKALSVPVAGRTQRL